MRLMTGKVDEFVVIFMFIFSGIELGTMIVLGRRACRCPPCQERVMKVSRQHLALALSTFMDLRENSANFPTRMRI